MSKQACTSHNSLYTGNKTSIQRLIETRNPKLTFRGSYTHQTSTHNKQHQWKSRRKTKEEHTPPKGSKTRGVRGSKTLYGRLDGSKGC